MDLELLLSSFAALVSIFAGVMALRERAKRQQDAEHEATVTIEKDGSTQVYSHLRGQKLDAVLEALKRSEAHREPVRENA